MHLEKGKLNRKKVMKTLIKFIITDLLISNEDNDPWLLSVNVG
jgi:hypothetical protein